MKSHESEVLDALQAVLRVIEMTYGHDEEGERRDDAEPESSAADVVEALCNVELLVTSAAEAVASSAAEVVRTSEPMTDTARLEFLREVSQALFEHNESWTDCARIGGNIAYLLHAIAQPGHRSTSLYSEDDPDFLELMRDTFARDHAVWRHLDIDP